jgi:hypothetical protein
MHVGLSLQWHPVLMQIKAASIAAEHLAAGAHSLLREQTFF